MGKPKILYVWPYWCMALLQYLDLGRHREALTAWRNATLQKADHVSAWSNMLILLDQLGQFMLFLDKDTDFVILNFCMPLPGVTLNKSYWNLIWLIQCQLCLFSLRSSILLSSSRNFFDFLLPTHNYFSSRKQKGEGIYVTKFDGKQEGEVVVRR